MVRKASNTIRMNLTLCITTTNTQKDRVPLHQPIQRRRNNAIGSHINNNQPERLAAISIRFQKVHLRRFHDLPFLIAPHFTSSYQVNGLFHETTWVALSESKVDVLDILIHDALLHLF